MNAYDPAGQVVAHADALGRTTQSAYDARGRLARAIAPDPDGAGPLPAPATRYQYDAAGNVVTVTDQLNRQTAYAYDTLNRRTQATLPDPDDAGPLPAPVTLYGYDNAGDLTTVTATSATNSFTRVTTYTYDTAGRRTSETLPDPDGAGTLLSPFTQYAYDTLGNLRGVTDRVTATQNRVTTFEYDVLNRSTRVTQPDPDGAGQLTPSYMEYTYDDVGNVLTTRDALNCQRSG